MNRDEQSSSDIRVYANKSEREFLHIGGKRNRQEENVQYDEEIILEAPRNKDKQLDKFDEDNSDLGNNSNRMTSINKSQEIDTKNYSSNSSILKKKRSIVKLSPMKPFKSQTGRRIYYQGNQQKKNNFDSVLNPFQIKLKSKIRYEEIQDIHNFTKESVSINKILTASLKKDDSGTKKVFPRSDLYFTQELRYIMSSKRKPCHLTSIFHLSSQIKDDILETDESYTGTLKSNFSGSYYNIYNEDQQIIASIFYDSQISFKTRPRALEVYVISPSTSYDQLAGIDGKRNLKQLYEYPQNFNNQKVYKLVNKKPKWNERKGVWGLNFKGRNFLGSVKNMILVNQNGGEDDEVMTFGKTDPETFQLQIHYPLSPRIVMGIVCSSFDFKWVSQ